MKMKDAVQKAIVNQDADVLGKIVDFLRFKYGMNYNQCYDFVNNIQPVSKSDYEDLLYNSEYISN